MTFQLLPWGMRMRIVLEEWRCRKRAAEWLLSHRGSSSGKGLQNAFASLKKGCKMLKRAAKCCRMVMHEWGKRLQNAIALLKPFIKQRRKSFQKKERKKKVKIERDQIREKEEDRGSDPWLALVWDPQLGLVDHGSAEILAA
jgi:hypothetical protein